MNKLLVFLIKIVVFPLIAISALLYVALVYLILLFTPKAERSKVKEEAISLL
jgi:hypothetical protein